MKQQNNHRKKNEIERGSEEKEKETERVRERENPDDRLILLGK